MKIGKVKCETKKNFEKLFGNEDILARERKREREKETHKGAKAYDQKKESEWQFFFKKCSIPGLFYSLFSSFQHSWS